MTRRIVLRVVLDAEGEADEIELALVEAIGLATVEMAELRTSPPPAVRLHEDKHRLRFTVTCTIGRMIDADHAHRELAKRLRARLRGIGVETHRIAIEYGLSWQEPATSGTPGDPALG